MTQFSLLFALEENIVIHLITSPFSSYVGGGVRRGEVLHTETHHSAFGRLRVQEAAGEHLPAGLAEVL